MSPSAAGLLLEREVSALSGLLQNPTRPLVAVLGGAKVSDKIGVIDSFRRVADTILIGGAMCFPFLKALGPRGRRLAVRRRGRRARPPGAGGVAPATGSATILLPSDLVLADHFGADAAPVALDGIDVPDGMMGLDIGPRSAEAYATIIATAGTVFWNGPMGAFEFDAVRGRHACGRPGGAPTPRASPSSAAATRPRRSSSSASATRVTHLSTGGGAALELIEGRELPGVAVLS